MIGSPNLPGQSQSAYAPRTSRLDRAGRPLPGLMNSRLLETYARAAEHGVPAADLNYAGCSDPSAPFEMVIDSYFSEVMIRLDEAYFGPMEKRDPDLPTAGSRDHVLNWTRVWSLAEFAAQLLRDHYCLNKQAAQDVMLTYFSELDLVRLMAAAAPTRNRGKDEPGFFMSKLFDGASDAAAIAADGYAELGIPIGPEHDTHSHAFDGTRAGWICLDGSQSGVPQASPVPRPIVATEEPPTVAAVPAAWPAGEDGHQAQRDVPREDERVSQYPWYGFFGSVIDQLSVAGWRARWLAAALDEQAMNHEQAVSFGLAQEQP